MRLYAVACLSCAQPGCEENAETEVPLSTNQDWMRDEAAKHLRKQGWHIATQFGYPHYCPKHTPKETPK